MLNLTIQHKIYLTKEERYKLHNIGNVDVVGYFLPVWFGKNYTSEPSSEVFCKYYLINDKQDVPTKILEDGFKMSIPHREGHRPHITNEEWRELERLNKLDNYKKQCIPEFTSKNLLDKCDGGTKKIFYREYNKIKRNNHLIKIAHYIFIEDIDFLNQSMCNLDTIS